MAYRLIIGPIIKFNQPPPPHGQKNLTPFKNQIKTKVFSKLNTLDLSPVVKLQYKSLYLKLTLLYPCHKKKNKLGLSWAKLSSSWD